VLIRRDVVEGFFHRGTRRKHDNLMSRNHDLRAGFGIMPCAAILGPNEKVSEVPYFYFFTAFQKVFNDFEHGLDDIGGVLS